MGQPETGCSRSSVGGADLSFGADWRSKELCQAHARVGGRISAIAVRGYGHRDGSRLPQLRRTRVEGNAGAGLVRSCGRTVIVGVASARSRGMDEFDLGSVGVRNGDLGELDADDPAKHIRARAAGDADFVFLVRIGSGGTGGLGSV